MHNRLFFIYFILSGFDHPFDWLSRAFVGLLLVVLVLKPKALGKSNSSVLSAVAHLNPEFMLAAEKGLSVLSSRA